MSDNIFENLTNEEQNNLWQWTKEAEKAGMTLTEYLESISPLDDKKEK